MEISAGNRPLVSTSTVVLRRTVFIPGSPPNVPGRCRLILSASRDFSVLPPQQTKTAPKMNMKAARAAWEAGRDALQEYVEVANKGMVRSLRKIDTPFST